MKQQRGFAHGQRLTWYCFNWQTENMKLRVENDIQLDGMQVFDETGRQLYPQDWVRGGQNLSFLGKIHFESSQLSPLSGEFDLRVLGQNVTYDGDPIGQPILLAQESNPNFGVYNISFTSPIESSQVVWCFMSKL